jgi:hypothetical protein
MSLFDLYRGADLTSRQTRQYGSTLGSLGGFDIYQRRKRGTLLANLINDGKLNVKDLSPDDAKAAGENLDKRHSQQAGIGGFFNAIGNAAQGVGGLIGNLGEDTFNAVKGLPMGVFETAKAIDRDIVDPLDAFSSKGHVFRDIIKPIGQQYAYTYGGKGTKDSFLERLYKHPLGPILDVATVASLGAGGAARAGTTLARAGRIAESNPLARIARTERAPLDFNRGIAGERAAEGELQLPEIARYYSHRPLRKALQIITDKAGDRVPFIRDVQSRAATNQFLRHNYSIKESQVLGQIKHDVIAPMAERLQRLSPEEVQAFDLMNRGLTSEEALNAYQHRVRSALEGTAAEGTNVSENAGMLSDLGTAKKLAENRAYIPQEVRNLVLHPQSSPALMEASQSYRSLVDEHVRPHLDDEKFQGKARELLNELEIRPVEGMTNVETVVSEPRGATRRLFDRAAEDGVYVDDLLRGEGAQTAPRALPTPDHPFAEPTLMPSEFARGFQYQSGWGPFTKEGWFRDRSRQLYQERLSIQNIFQESTLGFRPNAEPLLSGLQRPDARAYVDFLAKHHRDTIEKGFSQQMFDRWAVKDHEGEPMMFKNQEEVTKKLGPGYVLTNPVFPMHWFEQETTTAQFINGLMDRGFDVNSPELMAAIGAEAEDAVVDATFAARRMPGVAVPDHVADYQLKLETASRAYDNKFFRARARAMNHWRTLTLAFMPRWALNTAVGSVVLGAVKGITPRDYMMAGGLRKAGFFEEPEMAGVDLGNVTGMELLENKAQGVGERATGVNLNPVTSKIMTRVQGIEDYFRRASMVHSLKREARANGDTVSIVEENGQVIADFERAKGPRTVGEMIDFVVDNPELTRRALEDVNRFSYNFATMGPLERRIVRQIIPFWGWYKFISGLAYRLPVDYPGRTNLMLKIGQMGESKVEDVIGKNAPLWLKGVLPLSKDKGMLEYLSTMGLNPFSQFFNPGSPEGVSGTVQLAQLAPDLQAGLAAFGIDTMRGGTTPISPTEGIGSDFFGSLIDTKSGREVDPGQVAWFRRGLGSLLRSVPELRIAERAAAGGRSVYPESIPLIAQRPMATAPETRVGAGIPDVLEQFIGVAPKPYNLRKNDALFQKRLKYARTRNKRAKQSLERALKK